MLLTKRKIKAEKSQLERENDLQILIDSWIRHGFVSDLQPSPSRRRTKDHLLQVDFFCPQLTTDIITFKGNVSYVMLFEPLVNKKRTLQRFSNYTAQVFSIIRKTLLFKIL
ncbi:hypothetical protein L5515_017367 [Caenorhabditis briggsae]|uniref:Uncharacterized protein n=1 Tax=Caenorhabditis briggsae TaxID=6238 RepID=A0AAE9FE33_CAEBR|nr:hypothetical protein L5515_017367 [Caenorhabditis briggsae]